jgi:tetratricopeptide (TPR) repeat protein
MSTKQILCALFMGGLLASQLVSQTVLWQEYVTLRDAMYNRQYPLQALVPLYEEAVKAAQMAFAGDELWVALSKCEYMMGRNYLYDEKKGEAGAHFDQGADYAKRAADASGMSEAWLMYAENVSQNCAVKPVSYALANGTKIAGFAARVLKADPANGAALHVTYAQDVYAPAPFHNYKRGIKNMTQVLEDKSVRMQKDDEFNVISAIGYAHFQLKNYGEAAVWLSRALAIYPGNQFVGRLLRETKTAR